MNVVFLSPHFPPNFYPFCARLHELGATVLGVADEPYEKLRPELRAALTEYYQVRSLDNYDEVLRALGHFTARHGKLHRLDSHSEHWLPTEARLREDFNIPGLRPSDLDRARRKSRMKEVFTEAGISSARGRLCPDAASVRSFVRDVGYPVVAKPDIGVGAASTYKLTSDADLEAFLANGLAADYMLEEFVDGTIVTYDGLADQEGRVVFESSLHYSRGVMEVVNEGTDLWYFTEREIAADLRAAGQRLVVAFGVRERFFHFEFFRLPGGQLLALEVNLRPPGGLTVDMWNYQNDADVFRGWASLLTTGQTEIANERPWHVAYVGRKRHTTYAVGHDELLCRLGPLLVHHERVDDVFSAAIGHHGYILRAVDVEVLAGAAEFIQRRA
jgi:biotin carboxylase